MKKKILTGILALTVVAFSEQGTLFAAEAIEQSDTARAEDVKTNMETTSAKSDVATKDKAVGKEKKDRKEMKDKKEKKTGDKKDLAKAPLTIEGDELFFDDASGEVHAKGNVVVTQNPDTMLTEEMRGNTKTTEVWIDGVATIIQPEVQTTMTGHSVHYNYGTKLGVMADPHGMVGSERVAAKDSYFYPDRMVSHNATMTRCNAKVPDYHISATKVEIWPGDKLIAHNAKVWIKNTVIYSVAVYQRSLRKDEKNEMPKIGYSNQDGVSIEQYYEYPLTNNWALATDQIYYTKQGYKPQYQLIDREHDYSFRVMDGEVRDTDNHWVKKEPEFRFDWYSKRIGKLPWSYTFTAISGKWKDSAKSSWHQDYTLYFTHDPIKLSDTLTWDVGTGYETVRESYNGSVVNTMKFNTTFTKSLSKKLTIWTAYNYTQNTQSLFSYNSVSVGREMVNGFSYTPDKLNTFVYSNSYDLQYRRSHSDTFTWARKLHCWTMTLNYVKYNDKSNPDAITWDLAVARW